LCRHPIANYLANPCSCCHLDLRQAYCTSDKTGFKSVSSRTRNSIAPFPVHAHSALFTLLYFHAAQNKCCYGCGTVLQCDDPRGAGHVVPEKYALKKAHRQLSQVCTFTMLHHDYKNNTHAHSCVIVYVCVYTFARIYVSV
jgi:hypothetical protein